MSGDIVPNVRDDDYLYILSEEDIQDILSDCFVDIREIVSDDETASECISVTYDRFTDEFYSDE